MADRVFIADFIKKKRRRKGRSEYLVKWKGYSSKFFQNILPECRAVWVKKNNLIARHLIWMNTLNYVRVSNSLDPDETPRYAASHQDPNCLQRHSTWEPEYNILDTLLIKQFEEEGYDPRRRRTKTKRRRKSEITESRPLSNKFLYGIEVRDSDSESDHSTKPCPHDRGSPSTVTTYDALWKTDVSRGDQALFNNHYRHAPTQKKADEPSNDIDIERTVINFSDATQKDHEQLYKNGTSSCHPKMRAKFMFRAGDFDNCDWGQDWCSSDSEKGHKEGVEEIPVITEVSQLKRKHGEDVDDDSSRSSDTTVPAIDELETESSYNKYAKWDFTETVETNEDMPKLLKIEELDTERTKSLPENTNEKRRRPDGDISVTEITHEQLTITFVESTTQKGFFKFRTDI